MSEHQMELTSRPRADYMPRHFAMTVDDRVATITLNRPERKNPLTFASYAELRDLFRDLAYAKDIAAVVFTGAGGNFCSGGDVREIIGPLTRAGTTDLLAFTRMTGDLVLAIRSCPQPVLAAIDGVCVGAGAAIAMACDLRYGTPRARVAYLFTRVGLAGCDMGACTFLPRLIGQGRASELLLTGRSMTATEGSDWGFYNALHDPADLLAEATAVARSLADGPTFAHGITKTMINQEWTLTVEQAIEAEAQSQALCMHTQDFTRAYDAFMDKRTPEFQGD